MRHRAILALGLAILSTQAAACGSLALLAPATATPTATPTFTPTSTATPTPLPPTDTPTPTPARPAAPEDFQVKATCTMDPVSEEFHVSIHLTWQDRSDNEMGFDIFRNRTFFRSVDEGVTETYDSVNTARAISGSFVYSIQSFNLEGKSARVDAKVAFACR